MLSEDQLEAAEQDLEVYKSQIILSQVVFYSLTSEDT